MPDHVLNSGGGPGALPDLLRSGVVDLYDDVQCVLNAERAWRYLRIGIAKCGDAPATDLDSAGALEPEIDRWAGRAGNLLQPAQGTEFFHQIDHAQRPGLPAHKLDSLFYGLFLPERQTRRECFPAAFMARDSCGRADIIEPGAVAIDRRAVYAEASCKTFRLAAGHR
jgi:hypothetical protein